jgi:predicted PurR-regulated permease PerM
LEARVGTNQIVLLVVALILVVVISVSITMMAVSAMSDDEEAVSPEAITELQQQISDLSAQNEALTQQVKSLKKILPVIQDQLGNTSNIKLLTIVMEQEKANQTFLDALRTGMYDLAHMLPGSRTWLEVYGEKVDSAEAYSQKREKDLKRILKQSESGDEDDDLW